MTAAELAGFVRGIAPAVREYVATALVDLSGRLATAEQRLASVRDGQDGVVGAPGEPGAVGPVGAKGDVGPVGETGAQGPQGPPGEPGAQGLTGIEGERGHVGDVGIPGRDGRDGLAGVQGEKGLDGTHGRDGIDGLGFDDVTAEMTGNRTLTISFVKGDRVKTFPVVLAGLVLYRGVYEDGKAYEAGDSVTFAGSQWIAKEATSAKPGESGPASRSWQLAVKVGREGKTGAPGAPGAPGPRGAKGDDGRHGGSW